LTNLLEYGSPIVGREDVIFRPRQTSNHVVTYRIFGRNKGQWSPGFFNSGQETYAFRAVRFLKK
jgi:hypothetical protein